jgi:hypothetical protein
VVFAEKLQTNLTPVVKKKKINNYKKDYLRQHITRLTNISIKKTLHQKDSTNY